MNKKSTVPPQLELSGLSDEEIEGMMKFAGVKPPAAKKGPSKSKEGRSKKPAIKDDFSVDAEKEETVSKKEYEKKVKALQKKIDDLTEKNEQLKKEKKSVSFDLSSIKKSKEDMDSKCKQLYDKNKELISERDGYKKDLDSLRKQQSKTPTVVTDDSEIKKLKKKIDSAEKEKNDLKRELEEKIALLKDTNEKLAASENEIEELKKCNAAPVVSADAARIISRISATEFSSRMFTDGRYAVKLAKDASFISFAVDITGSALCSGKKISLPALAKYIPFSAKRDYEASDDGGVLTISLR